MGVGGGRDVTQLGRPRPGLEDVHLDRVRHGGDDELIEHSLAVLEHLIVRVFV